MSITRQEGKTIIINSLNKELLAQNFVKLHKEPTWVRPRDNDHKEIVWLQFLQKGGNEILIAIPHVQIKGKDNSIITDELLYVLFPNYFVILGVVLPNLMTKAEYHVSLKKLSLIKVTKTTSHISKLVEKYFANV